MAEYLFTIHFATINTLSLLQMCDVCHAFTIHFATINTEKETHIELYKDTFTIHFATINTYVNTDIDNIIRDLQYTLLLLIPIK